MTAPVSAADQIGEREEITMSPAATKIKAEAGKSVRGELTVLNTGDKAFDFTLYARPYSVETKAYNPNYSDTTERGGAYAWVQFDKTKGHLAPGKSQKFGYTISVPADAAGGGHYGVLFAETVADKSDKQIVVRNKRVGSILRLTVDGDVKLAGDVTDVDIPWLQFHAPLKSTAEVSNSGNVDFDADSVMVVKTVFGKEVFRSEKSNVVYPDKPRLITAEWADPSWTGLYKVEHTVSAGDSTESAESLVLLVPRWLLLLLGVIILVGGIYATLRRIR